MGGWEGKALFSPLEVSKTSETPLGRSVLPRTLGSPGGLVTEIFNSACANPAVDRIKFHQDLGILISVLHLVYSK